MDIVVWLRSLGLGNAMIDRVVGDSQLSASIRQNIIERTDGIPLFVEEMTKASPGHPLPAGQ